jgi:hypothetical protein
MARKKAPALSPEAIAANAAADTQREKEKQARQRNAEKQKRFRESMKEAGYRRVTLWDAPGPTGQPGRMAGMGYRQVPAWELPEKNADKIRAAKITLAVRIRESSLHIAARSPEVKKALSRAAGEFLKALGNAPEGKAVYNDFLELVALLDDPWGEE